MAMRINCKSFIRSNALLLLTLLGVAVGFAFGFALRPTNPSSDAKVWIGLPGEIFLRLLRMMIIPLIVSSVISGTASLNPRSNGKISLIALGYIVATNLLGCIFGIILAVTIKPGNNNNNNDKDKNKNNKDKHNVGLQTVANTTAPVPSTQDLQTQDIFADLIRNIFPDNVITACFQTTQTQYGEKTTNENTTVLTKTLGTTSGSNIIGIIFCATVLGIATGSIGETGRPFHNFFNSAMEVVLKILRWFLWFTPIGVASLIMVSILNVDDLQTRFLQLGLLILTVTVGVLFQQLVFIPLLYFLCFFSNPLRFLVNVFPAWSIAFASTSTAVAIPEMITCCERYHGVDVRVSRFVVPFTVTLSANGSALFITASAIFIGQINHMEMNAGKVVIIGVLTAISVMALPAIPSSSIVVIVIILETLNFPAEDVALLLAVEWYLDRMRSSSNGVSHVFCALFTYRWCKNSLPPLEKDALYLDVSKKHSVNSGIQDSGVLETESERKPDRYTLESSNL
ncbi:excitatory amino acid transporter 2-like [Liolophura sinensis]|uniref:excitatory amino acid transporter 2-like n=1 Tax=Liolophura sinensis TaxID=3198878 RepID=UPI003158715D